MELRCRFEEYGAHVRVEQIDLWLRTSSRRHLTDVPGNSDALQRSREQAKAGIDSGYDWRAILDWKGRAR